jgi:2',3'-cyclic-nucleotide 3'-phosphodiesterase
MPGSSLWLVPPTSSPLNKILQTLISDAIPFQFPTKTTHDFIPHITLTSGIEPFPSDPQHWLNDLKLPDADSLHVRVQQPEAGVPFFKKLTLACEKNDGLKALAEACRAQATKVEEAEAARWVEKEYLPHCSLV